MDAFCSDDTKILAKALIQVQRSLLPAAKDGNNPFTRSNYATLNSVMNTCREALLNCGIWLCQYPVPVETPNCLGLMTKLTHADSGQWQSSLTVIPLPKSDPQGMGSAITYARRYALTAMLGIVTEDDDGEAAKIDPRQSTRQSKPAQTSSQAPSVSTSPQTARHAAQQNCLNTDTHASRPLAAVQTQESPSDEQTLTTNQKKALNRPSDILAHLPQLDGIVYKVQQAEDGRDYIVASGNTIGQKHLRP